MSSGEPKISSADRPSTLRTASVHSINRGPRIGWARYAVASATLLIEYRLEVELNPSPSNCGKMYHIQCDRFRPLLISESAWLVVFLLRTQESAKVVRVACAAGFVYIGHQATSKGSSRRSGHHRKSARGTKKYPGLTAGGFTYLSGPATTLLELRQSFFIGFSRRHLGVVERAATLVGLHDHLCGGDCYRQRAILCECFEVCHEATLGLLEP